MPFRSKRRYLRIKMNNKEVVKRIESIFERMRFTQFYSLGYAACPVDSLVRIYEEKNCEECILTDTVRIRREDMLGKGMYPLCPLEMKADIRVLK